MAKLDVTKLKKKELISLFKDLLQKEEALVFGDDFKKEAEIQEVIWNKRSELNDLESKKNDRIASLNSVRKLESEDNYLNRHYEERKLKTLIPFLISLACAVIIFLLLNMQIFMKGDYNHLRALFYTIFIGLVSSILIYKKKYFLAVIIGVFFTVGLHIFLKDLIVYSIIHITIYFILRFIVKRKNDLYNNQEKDKVLKKYEEKEKHHTKISKLHEDEKIKVDREYSEKISKLRNEIDELERTREHYAQKQIENIEKSIIDNEIYKNVYNMHRKYQDMDALKAFIDYLEKGLCDTYKECINKYEQDLKDNEMKQENDKRYKEELEKRQELEKQRDLAIAEQNRLINEKLEEHNRELKDKLSNMDDKLKNMNDDLIDVKIESEVLEARHKRNMKYATKKEIKRDKDMKEFIESKYKEK